MLMINAWTAKVQGENSIRVTRWTTIYDIYSSRKSSVQFHGLWQICECLRHTICCTFDSQRQLHVTVVYSES